MLKISTKNYTNSVVESFKLQALLHSFQQAIYRLKMTIVPFTIFALMATTVTAFTVPRPHVLGTTGAVPDGRRIFRIQTGLCLSQPDLADLPILDNMDNIPLLTVNNWFNGLRLVGWLWRGTKIRVSTKCLPPTFPVSVTLTTRLFVPNKVLVRKCWEK